MMKMTARWKRLCSAMAKIHIVDKFLIVFMILLMLQSVYSLFANYPTSEESTHIDIIVRTSAAAIFGYFLSINFIRHASNGAKGESGSSLENRAINIKTVSNGGIQNRIGFTSSDSDRSAATPDMGSASYNKNQNSNVPGVNKLQIIIISTIALFCLVVLIFARDISALNADMAVSASGAAIGAQFRDFVSGCIGFLIGSPTTNTNQ